MLQAFLEIGRGALPPMSSNEHIFKALLFTNPSLPVSGWGQDLNKGYTQYMSGLVNLTVLRMTQWKVA